MASAESALALGDNAVLTARRPQLLQEWADRNRERVLVLPLDVTDTQRIRDAVRAAGERFDGIDVLVNNAGRGWYGSVEGTSDADVRRSFELNFFPDTQVLKAVLPGMRTRRSGWFVNMWTPTFRSSSRPVTPWRPRTAGSPVIPPRCPSRP
ncbi:SDR family NAD(P)-dependent oxidoreductase [Streptomyces sp. NPDC029554]|uniref:SDR family NAD(P)-dependent oxidoreductase n=1 Tax=Streptomyces sp. NPDC029554 TaxID=3155126 RepID=UPI0033E9A3E0